MKDYIRFIRSEPRLLAFGFVLTFFSSFGQTFFISQFGEELRRAFDLSHSDYGLTYSVATLCSGLTLIALGRRIDAVDLRTFTLSLCGGLLAACLILAASTHVAMLALAFFLLRLCGQGLLGHTAMTTMSRYFDRRRGKALSIAGLGFPAGEAILPTIVVVTIATMGWRATWMGVAGAVTVVLIPAVFFLLEGHADRHTAHLAQAAQRASIAATSGSESRQWTLREVLRDPRFYHYLPGIIAPGFIVTGFFFHQELLVETKQWTATWFAACFVAFAAAQVLTSLLAGPLVDRFGGTKLMSLFLIPLALSLVVIALGSSPMSAALFLSLFGVTAGLSGTIVSAMWAEVYGTRHLGAIRSMAMAAMVFGTASSPVLFGLLSDAQVPMESIAWMGCIYTCAAMALIASAGRLRTGSGGGPGTVECEH